MLPHVLIIYHYITNHPKTQQLKITLTISQFLWVRNLRAALRGTSGSRRFTKLHSTTVTSEDIWGEESDSNFTVWLLAG